MTPIEPPKRNKAEHIIIDMMLAQAAMPKCHFCHARAVGMINTLYVCTVHGRKYGGYYTEYAKGLRGENEAK